MQTSWKAHWPDDDSLEIAQRRGGQARDTRLNRWHGRCAQELTRLLLDAARGGSMAAADRWNQAQTQGSLPLSGHQVRRLLLQAMLVQQAVEYQLGIARDCHKHDIASGSLPARCLFAIRNASDHCAERVLRRRVADRELQLDEDRWNSTLADLENRGLIQLISCPDGQRYVDANPLPHAHLWIEPLGILIDCDASTAARFTRSAAGPSDLHSHLAPVAAPALQTILIPVPSDRADAVRWPASAP